VNFSPPGTSRTRKGAIVSEMPGSAGGAGLPALRWDAVIEPSRPAPTLAGGD
jgi:hypothetical protein